MTDDHTLFLEPPAPFNADDAFAVTPAAPPAMIEADTRTVETCAAPEAIAVVNQHNNLMCLKPTAQDDVVATLSRRAHTLEYAAYIARQIAAANRPASSVEVDVEATAEAASSTLARDKQQHIVFGLDNLLYAVPLVNMTAIERPLPLTALPFVPSWHAGIANLRGDILSVVDLRTFLRMNTASRTRATRVIVMRDGETTVGFIVDSVRRMMRFDSADMHPPVTPPATSTERRRSFIEAHYLSEQDDEPIAVLNATELIRASQPKRMVNRETPIV